MRKVSIFLIIIIGLLSCQKQTKIPKEQNDISEINSVEKKSTDTFAREESAYGTKIYSKNVLSDDKNGLYIYFYLVNGKPQDLKFYIKYNRPDISQFQDVYQFSVNGKKYTYKANYNDGPLFWYDYGVRKEDLNLFKELKKSDEAHIIFKNGVLINISDDTKSAIQNTLEYYQQLGGQLPSVI